MAARMSADAATSLTMTIASTTAQPETPESAAHLQALVAAAYADGTALRIAGSGTWLDAGRPCRASRVVCTRALCDVVEYVPGDLVITVGAGMTLAEIAAVTERHGQQLALDPFTSSRGLTHGTIGATIATASHGPLALGYGRARDLVLGLSFITGTGMLARAGGRVVKNVAGFDLVRLMTGAWGTLGILTEISLRLHARPPVDETFAIAIDLPTNAAAQHQALTDLVSRLNSAPLLATTQSLSALMMVPAESTAHLPAAQTWPRVLPQASVLLLARAAGNRVRVDAMRHSLATLGDLTVMDPTVWDAVRTSEHGNITWRLSDAPTRTANTLQRVRTWQTESGVTDVVTLVEPLRGVVHVSGMVPTSAADPMWRLPHGAIAERLVDAAWRNHPALASDVLSQKLRERFDPGQVLNPGIFGEPLHVTGGTSPSAAMAAST
jgi:glycolate oxidase FAD binding subunit